jgi:hypothetical protein
LLEAILMNPQIGLKVFIENPVEVSAFWMTCSIDGGPIAGEGEAHGGARDGGAVEVRGFGVEGP